MCTILAILGLAFSAFDGPAVRVQGGIVAPLKSGCSCVFFDHDDEFGYGLTAAHCVTAGGEVTAVGLTGKEFRCRVIAVDKERDLAVVKCFVEHVGNVSLPLAHHEPGEVSLYGFPAGSYQVQEGLVTGEVRRLDHSDKLIIDTPSTVRAGFSGGAVVSDSGLVGIVTHQVSGGAGCSVTDWFVDRAVSRAADKVQTQVTTAANDSLQFSLRDGIMAAIGWFLFRYFGIRLPANSQSNPQ